MNAINVKFKWKVHSSILSLIKINIQVYIVDIDKDIPFGKTSFKVGDLFTQQPVKCWLKLSMPEIVR